MNRHYLLVGAAIAALAISAANAATDGGFVVPEWAYPGNPAPPAAAPPFDDLTLLHVPDSGAAFTQAQVIDPFAPPDWHPDSHPPMPEIVARGRKPMVRACGYCHLPDGTGRPENASLAGLPDAYIRAQVADIGNHVRRSAWTGPLRTTELMQETAEHATDDEIAAAAEYFSKLGMTRKVDVVEAARVPRTREFGWLYVPVEDAGDEPLGQRIIEMPVGVERHERRDSKATYRAYVPMGSIARGRQLAQNGGGVCSGAGTLMRTPGTRLPQGRCPQQPYWLTARLPGEVAAVSDRTLA